MARKNEDGIYVNYDSIRCDRWSFEGDAESIKSYIDSVVIQAKEKGMVGTGRFDFSIWESHYDGYELDVKYEFDRVETEKEKTTREKAEEKAKAAAAAKRKATIAKRKLKEDSDYQEYLRLKEKFKEIQ